MRSTLLCGLLLLATAAAAEPDTPACSDSPAAVDVGAAGLTLNAALRAALRYHPNLRAAACDIDAAAGRALQAGLRPNPVASLEVENFAGSDAYSGFDAAETTLQVSQIIELGHKRARRAALANAERELAVWEREAQRLLVITATREAYVEVLAAQARLALARDLARLSRSVHETVRAKVRAGKVASIEASRALVDVQRTALAVTNAEQALGTARRRLALNWGSDGATLGEAAGDLAALPPPSSYEQLVAALEHNPALARWPSELERRARALELARAQGVQDVTLSGGLRQFAATDDVGVVFGISLPLPLFDRNQGAVLAAQAEMAAVDAGRDGTRRALLAQLLEQHEILTAAAAEDATLRTETLPLSVRIYTATAEGYRQGKFGLIDVLDAQRTLFETRVRHVDALSRAQRAVAAIEGLIGTGLPPPSGARAPSSSAADGGPR